MAPKFHLRKGVYEEVPEIYAIGEAAFASSPLNVAIYKNATEEERRTVLRAWRLARMQRNFLTPGVIYIVAVARDDDTGLEEIAGYTSWQRPLTEVDPNAGKSDEERAAERAAERSSMPSCVDAVAWDAFYEAGETAVDKWIGKEASGGMWTPLGVAVHPKYQRMGVASMMMRWGFAEAEKSGTDVYLVATEAGRFAYLAVGFEEVSKIWCSVYYAWIMRWRLPRAGNEAVPLDKQI